MPIEYEFELKLGGGKVVKWNGKDGVDAAQRYADAHPGVTVIAWRWPKVDLHIGIPNIIEP